jgi:lantibiotic transport system ATP-binding protein
MEYCVSTYNLSKQYGKELAVNRVDLSIPYGAVFGFLGPNGAGKTTTLKMLLGLIHPSSGNVSILGQAMTPQNRLSILKNVGSLVESPSYYGHLTARENLEIIRSLRNLSRNEIDEVLKIVRLDHEEKKQVSKFSLGMKQRLGIATALMGKPKLLLLDEPTNGLDPAGIQEIRELIKSLPTTYDITVVVSSHLLSEIDQIADHISIIRRGELVFQDTLAALHARSTRNIALRTTDNAKASSLLNQTPIINNCIILPYVPDEKAAEISLFLAQKGIGIIRMEQREKNLENIFLEMTGSEGTL